MTEISLTTKEWQRVGPDECHKLRGLGPDGRGSTEALIRELADQRILEVTSLSSGRSVQTFSYVGTVRVGDLRVTILPKIRGMPLLALLLYAYRLRDLGLRAEVGHGVENAGLVDLLIMQLRRETEELLLRGLHRSYQRREELLASPRGRIDFVRLAARPVVTTAALPCVHHHREEDTLVNRILLAGLDLASRMTEDLELRYGVRRVAAVLRDTVSPVVLCRRTWEELAKNRNRLVRHYEPALSIIELLAKGQGPSLDGRLDVISGHGFLFDMNRFYQRLVGKFLEENLPKCEVLAEHGMRGIVNYLPEFNPQGRTAGVPRPDFVIRQGGRTIAVLDAKYRDIWDQKLPRHMLYQLALYAIGRRDGNEAAILFPTLDPGASESRLEVLDPECGRPRAFVCLRPVNLLRLAELVVQPHTAARARERECLARWMAGLPGELPSPRSPNKALWASAPTGRRQVDCERARIG